MGRLKYSIFCLAIILGATCGRGQDQPPYELPPINYSAAQPHDPVSNLQARIKQGLFHPGQRDRDVVQALLSELKIPRESQVLVFSKTSLQRQHIRPEHPRSLFFTDTCYVGWVPGGLIELTTIDPVIGPVFYAVTPETLRSDPIQAINRDQDCLRCHGGTFVRDIPGLFVRSLFTDEDGEPLLRHGSEVVTQATPFADRWGGWYVTGKHGSALHRGNTIASEKNDRLVVDFQKGANITNLNPFFPTEEYLTDSSDIIALLVLEYQTTVQNVLTHAAINSRRMMDYQKNLQIGFKETITAEPAYDSVKSVFDSTAEEIVDNFLYKDEAGLPAGLEGDPAFQGAFQKNARPAKDGSSLKDFNLHGHLFQNRCSYLIYSETFLQLPGPLKTRVYQRLVKALSPATPDPRYAYLDADERTRISKILRQTHAEFKKFTANKP